MPNIRFLIHGFIQRFATSGIKIGIVTLQKIGVRIPSLDAAALGVASLSGIGFLPIPALSEIGLGVASLTTIASSQAKLDSIIFTV